MTPWLDEGGGGSWIERVRLLVFVWATTLCGLAPQVWAAGQLPLEPPPRLVEVTFKSPEAPPLVGELVAESPRYGLLILDADGQLTAVSPNDGNLAIASIQEQPGPLVPTDLDALATKVLAFMPSGSRYFKTDHFVICYDTTEVYARWNAKLYEAMYNGMTRFWKEKGVDLCEPRFPMVALIFGTRDAYLEYAKRDFQGAENTFGYYTQTTNRLATFDLTGIEGRLPSGAKIQREELITQILSRPEAERQVATILHEACHQIAFNIGLQKRLGDYPLWLSEGIATFFESPDFKSSNGWGGTGKVNYYNLNNLRLYAPQRPADSIARLLVRDELLRQGETTTAAYAESWGLTFFLIKKYPKPFTEYLKLLHDRPLGNPADEKQRLAEFRHCFGEDLNKLDKEFTRFINGLR
jgi:hypothetical protein